VLEIDIDWIDELLAVEECADRDFLSSDPALQLETLISSEQARLQASSIRMPSCPSSSSPTNRRRFTFWASPLGLMT
jgi:hypothetical protein